MVPVYQVSAAAWHRVSFVLYDVMSISMTTRRMRVEVVWEFFGRVCPTPSFGAVGGLVFESLPQPFERTSKRKRVLETTVSIMIISFVSCNNSIVLCMLFI